MAQLIDAMTLCFLWQFERDCRLHRLAVRGVPAGRAEGEASAARLPRLAHTRLSLLHRAHRTLVSALPVDRRFCILFKC